MIRLNLVLVTTCIAACMSMVLIEPLQAQTRPKDGECEVDEIDMGDYCASLPPAVSEAEKKRRRVTRFRSESMMPGRTGSKDARVAPSARPVVAPKAESTPVAIPENGYVVQLGAFSSLEVARSVAGEIASPPGPVHIISLKRGDNVLWACILGPFNTRETAVISRNQAQQNKRFKAAYVKPLDPEIINGITHDNTEK